MDGKTNYCVKWLTLTLRGDTWRFSMTHSVVICDQSKKAVHGKGQPFKGEYVVAHKTLHLQYCGVIFSIIALTPSGSIQEL